MGEKTGIAWCDHTFNPWIGCTQVSPGCDHCYAMRDNKRFTWVNGWNGERKRTSEKNWYKVYRWAKKAAEQNRTVRIFCGSLMDVFDPSAKATWRADLWDLIYATSKLASNLEWLLLTKRPEHIDFYLPDLWLEKTPRFLRIGCTVENQEMADKRIPKLLSVWRGKNFLSVEPLLGNLLLAGLDPGTNIYRPWLDTHAWDRVIDWIICGGETGPDARPMHPWWATNLLKQCQRAKVPFFFKQWGEWLPFGERPANLAVFKKDLQTEGVTFSDQTFHRFAKIGARNAGRLLEGQEWSQFPDM